MAIKMFYRVKAQHSGFSLVELSIVLVILGLLTGGILGGQALMRAAELRAVANEAVQYHTTIMTFRDKYFALPGDMTNAYDFWNTDARCSADQLVTIADDSGCNGDGNGYFDYSTGEHFKGWLHLNLAGMINGSYSGSFTSAGDYQIGENIPASKLGKVWVLYYAHLGSMSYNAGSNLASHNTMHHGGGALNAEELWNIDTKIDDGKPGLGKFLGQRDCNVGDDQNTDTAVYDLQDTAQTCPFRYVME